MVAVVGTTITPYMQFYLQRAVAEKGIDEEELRLEQADAVVGSVWTNIIAIFIVVATATTIFAAGGSASATPPTPPRRSSRSRAPGRRAVRGRPVRRERPGGHDHADQHGLRDLRGLRLGVRRRQAVGDAPAFFAIYTFVLVVGRTGRAHPRDRPPAVILASQNLQGLLLPIVLVFMVLLVNDQRLMGRHANGRAAQRRRLGVRRAGGGARRRPARHDRPSRLRHRDRRLTWQPIARESRSIAWY